LIPFLKIKPDKIEPFLRILLMNKFIFSMVINCVFVSPAFAFNLECSTDNFETIYTNFMALESDNGERRTVRYETTDIEWQPNSLIISKYDSLLGSRNFYVINRETLKFSGSSYGNDAEGECRIFETEVENKI